MEIAAGSAASTRREQGYFLRATIASSFNASGQLKRLSHVWLHVGPPATKLPPRSRRSAASCNEPRGQRIHSFTPNPPKDDFGTESLKKSRCEPALPSG